MSPSVLILDEVLTRLQLSEAEPSPGATLQSADSRVAETETGVLSAARGTELVCKGRQK